MNALLAHKWGVSRAQDAIWARVAGMATSRAIRKPIMALHFKAHMDESYSDIEYVIGGYVATAETWAKFSGEWEELLPCATRDKQGNLRFHMTEMTSPERIKRVPAFYNVIANNNLIPIAARMEMQAFNGARERVRDACLRVDPTWRVNDFGVFDKPYLLLFHVLMNGFHRERESLAVTSAIPKEEAVDFIFDKGTGHENYIRTNWPAFIDNQPEEIKQLYGKTPDFADDVEVVALQAADFWAWWVREWFEEDSPEYPDLPERLKNGEFDGWRGKRGTPVSMIVATEDGIFDVIYGACLSYLAEWRELGR